MNKNTIYNSSHKLKSSNIEFQLLLLSNPCYVEMFFRCECSNQILKSYIIPNMVKNVLCFDDTSCVKSLELISNLMIFRSNPEFIQSAL